VAISIDWGTSVITIPKADTTLVDAGPPEVRKYDVDAFRLALKDLEDDPAGMPYPKTHNHNAEVSVSGVLYARLVEIIPPYTVEFEDGQYVVRLFGANHNIGDVRVANQVSIVVQNSAGLQVVVQGSGVTQQDKDDIVNQVYAHVDAGVVQSVNVDAIDALAVAPDAGIEIADGILDRPDGAEAGMTLRQWLRLGAALMFGKTAGFGTTENRFRNMGDTKNRVIATLDGSGNRTGVTLDAS